MLTSLNYNKREHNPWTTNSARYKYDKNNLDEHINKILNRSIKSDNESDDLEGEGVTDIIIPSNIIDT